MCGIIGFLDKSGAWSGALGSVALNMLHALSCRGPDSTGVALFRPALGAWRLQIKLPDEGDRAEDSASLLQLLRGHGEIVSSSIDGNYLQAAWDGPLDCQSLEANLLRNCPGSELVSVGRQLEVIKEVGSPRQLDDSYAIAGRSGSHFIGHTRLSTESRVDLSHSQPFWAHGVPDLATVHNGHITNYHKMRRQYEQRGYRFFTENDSEIIGVYLRDRLQAGLIFEDALRSSLDDFDGSFSYLAATGDRLAYVRDRHGFKPLIVAETSEFVAIATEEIALRRGLGPSFEAKEPAPGSIGIWSVPVLKPAVLLT